MHVSKKYVLPLSLCLNEPERPTLTAARRPSRLKLEQLTGADGPARSRALLGLEWKCHYHINHGCSRIDHSLCTEIMMAVCLSLRKTIILNAAPFITLWFALHGKINVFFLKRRLIDLLWKAAVMKNIVRHGAESIYSRGTNTVNIHDMY